VETKTGCVAKTLEEQKNLIARSQLGDVAKTWKACQAMKLKEKK
jgi:hypothetical protein